MEFRCWICLQTDHLQISCSQAKNDSSRKKKQEKDPKGCKFPEQQLSEEEDEGEGGESHTWG